MKTPAENPEIYFQPKSMEEKESIWLKQIKKTAMVLLAIALCTTAFVCGLTLGFFFALKFYLGSL